jgi:anti-sigma regulatory factor (Ser/Thr protein kinase)
MNRPEGTNSEQPDLRLELVSQPHYLAAARALIGKVAQRIGFNDSECGQITLAVDEALCNIINHGYDRRTDGRIWLNLWHLGAPNPGLRLVLEDLAKQVEPETIRSRDLDEVRPGGLGVHIIHQTMDEVRYEKRQGKGMRLTMVKRLRTPAPAPAAAQGGTWER